MTDHITPSELEQVRVRHDYIPQGIITGIVGDCRVPEGYGVTAQFLERAQHACSEDDPCEARSVPDVCPAMAGEPDAEPCGRCPECREEAAGQVDLEREITERWHDR